MSALCAFPPLIPAGGGVGGGVYSAGYMSADVSSSSSNAGRGVVGSFSAYSNAMATSQQSRVSGSASIPAYGSTFAAFHPHHPSAVAATTGNGGKSVMKMTQPESAWSSRTSSSTATATTEPPAAKRRCTDKIRSSTTWSDQHAPIWQSTSIPASVCPSGCTMCHLQRQQQQQQVQQHPQYPAGFHHQAYDSRRPLQEKHQNREESSLVATATNPSSNMATGLSHLKSSSMGMKSDQSSNGVSVPHRMPNVNRTLSVDPKKDYSAPLHVDCSVEYDLPRIVRPPPGAEPLLVFAPPRSSAVASLATPSGYHPSTWTTTTTNSRPLPPQWNQQQQGAASRIKSDKPSAASVKSHPAAIQQQQQQKLNSTSKSSNKKSSLLFQLKKGIYSDPIRPVTKTPLLPCRVCEWVELRRVSGDGLNLISSPHSSSLPGPFFVLPISYRLTQEPRNPSAISSALSSDRSFNTPLSLPFYIV